MKYAVLAGNYREYLQFLQEKADVATNYKLSKTGISEFDGDQFFYINSERSLRGVRNFEVICYGTWASRSNEEYSAIRILEKMANF